MIKVTKFNGNEMWLNPDLIQSLESTPDTVVTLTNGEKFVVQEPVIDLENRFLDYKRRIHEAPLRQSQLI